MYKEELIEEGIVLSSTNGFANVLLTKSKNCDNCAASILCISNSNETAIIKAIDPFNTNPNNIVKISLSGSNLIKLSILIYGLPFLLMIIGIIIGYFLFQNISNWEIYSIICGLFLVGFYFIILKLKNQILNKIFLPKIINVVSK